MTATPPANLATRSCSFSLSKVAGGFFDLAPNARLRGKVVPQAPDESARKVFSPEDNEAAHGRPMHLGWTKLLKRVFNLDLELKQIS
jgi:hypothetical protein